MESFEEAWPAFRSAALDNQPDVVARRVQFPLEVRGTLDEEPARPSSAADFPSLFQRLMLEDVGRTEEPTTLRHYLESGTAPPAAPAAVEAYERRVGLLLFQRDERGLWWLTRVYLEEP